MLSLVKSLLNLNDMEDYKYNIYENFDEFILTISSQNIILSENIEDIINNFIDKRDYLLELKFSINGGEPTILCENKYREFIEDCSTNKYYKDNDSDIEELNLYIKKVYKNKLISIYSLDEFSDYLYSLSLHDLLKKFSKYDGYINFVLIKETSSINSSSNMISFISSLDYNKTNYNPIENDILNKRLQICNFENNTEFNFEPFNFKLDNSINNKLDLLFEKLSIIFSLISIFDLSFIESNHVQLTLLGKIYKKYTLDFNTLNIENLSNIYKIFKWVYGDKNINDRILIARNVLGSYLISNNDIQISSDILKAIESNHKIYLKENFEQYVNIKNNIIDSLLQVEAEIIALLNSFTDNFIKNIIAICTFIFSIIILNSFSDKKFDNIFTKDITIISLAIIFLSFIFLYATCKDIKFKYEIVQKITNNISLNYKDLLTDNEVDKIFTDYQSITYVKSSLFKKINFFKTLWIIVLVIFFIVTFILGFKHFYYCFNKIMEFLIYIYGLIPHK